MIKQNQVHEVTHLNMCFVLFEVSSQAEHAISSKLCLHPNSVTSLCWLCVPIPVSVLNLRGQPVCLKARTTSTSPTLLNLRTARWDRMSLFCCIHVYKCAVCGVQHTSYWCMCAVCGVQHTSYWCMCAVCGVQHTSYWCMCAVCGVQHTSYWCMCAVCGVQHTSYWCMCAVWGVYTIYGQAGN